MSTAPAGWHRQPDGRDRYWDGERWTEDFRQPSEADTQQIPLDATRGMTAAESEEWGTGAAGSGPAGAPPGQSGYAPTPASYPARPYGYADGGPLSDKPRGNGWLKGCLIALLVVVVLAAVLVVAGIALFRAGTDRVSETIPTILPTELPTEVPTDLPSDLVTDLPTALPTDLPTDLPTLPGQGESAEAGVGEEFTLAGATIQAGWAVEEATLGFAPITMRAVPSESSAVPLIFEIVFFDGDTDVTRTTCTSPLEPAGETVEVVCVPVRGFTDGIDRIRASGLG